MSNVGPIRGLTTLQLLQLAAIALKKYYELNPTQVPKNSKTGLPISLANSTFIADTLAANLQIPMAKGVRAKIIKSLSGKAGSGKWFHDGTGENAFRAMTPEGQLIEAKRQQIYQVVQQYAGYLLGAPNLPLNQLYHPNNKPGATLGKGGNGSELDAALRTSYSFGTVKKGQKKPTATLQQRLDALRAVWQLTDPAVEPAAVERVGGGAIGRKKPFTRADTDARVAQSNGFIAANLAEFIASNVDKDNTMRGSPTEAQKNAVRRLAPAIRQAFVEETASSGGNVAVAQANIKALGQNPAALYQKVNQLVSLMGGAENLREAMWLVAGKVSLAKLLGGIGIHKPDYAEGKGFLHDPSVARGTAPETNAIAATRYVFDSLFDAYAQRGARGDLRPEDAQKRSNQRKAQGPRGILGSDDTALKGLSTNDPKKVASFAFKARQGLYSLEALRQGARQLGIQVDDGIVLHETLIGIIMDAIVRGYNEQFKQGSGPHVVAVAAAMGVKGFSKLNPTDPNQVRLAMDAVNRKADALNGRMTARCVNGQLPLGLGKKDLKRIAKANGIAADKVKDNTVACALLNSIVEEAPSSDPVSSGRRGEKTKAAPVSQGRSGRRRQAETGILAGLAGAPVLSPGRQALLGQASNTLVGQAAQFSVQPAAGGFGTVAPVSGGRASSPSRVAAALRGTTVAPSGTVVAGHTGGQTASGFGGQSTLPGLSAGKTAAAQASLAGFQFQ